MKVSTKETFYNTCGDCKVDHSCCCSFDKPQIAMPLMTGDEAQCIEDRLDADRITQFMFNNVSGRCGMKSGGCPFWKPCSFKNGGSNIDNPGCIIYDIRPLDCRLFPFDILWLDNSLWLVSYYAAFCAGNLSDEKSKLAAEQENIKLHKNDALKLVAQFPNWQTIKSFTTITNEGQFTRVQKINRATWEIKHRIYGK